MKKFKLLILSLAFVLPGLVFTSCSDDDESIDLQTEIVGKWNYATYSMSEIPPFAIGEDTIISEEKIKAILDNMLPYKRGSMLEFKSDEAKSLVLYQGGVVVETGKYTIVDNSIVTTQFGNQTPAKFKAYISGTTLALSVDKGYIKEMIGIIGDLPIPEAQLDILINAFYFELKFGKVDEPETAN